MIRRFIAWLGFLAALCLVGEAATIVGPIYQTYSNRPYSGPILMRPLSTPQANTPNLLTGGDFIVRTDTNGLFSVNLQPGNYRVQVGADRPFIIDVPTNSASYTLLERITNALAWNSSIVPATNSYALSLTTRSGVVKSSSDQADPVAWLTNDTATIGRWLGSVTAGTIDELIATSAPDYDVDNIVVNGWVTEQDGRGGDWYYDYGATTTTNRGMVVAWGSGRLLRKWGTEIDPVWFGADNSGSTSATSELQEAIDFAASPTYGEQSQSGQANSTAFSVVLSGNFKMTAPIMYKAVELRGARHGSSWGNYNANAVLDVHHGGHAIIVDMVADAPNYRIGSIRDLYFTGYSETYQTNKKAITAVTSRFVFDVANADAPPTLDDSTLWASHNTCFFYDPDGTYLGSARIASFTASATPGMTQVTLANDGTDVFSSINGTSGGALTTACKVVWPVKITDEYAPAYGYTDFNDPAAAGSCAIFIKSTSATFGSAVGNVRLSDLYIDRFHCGIRYGPKTIGIDTLHNIKTVRNKFAGISWPRPINSTDAFYTGQQWYSSLYLPDYGRVRTDGPVVTITAGSPATFTITGHGYVADSAIRFSSTSASVMTGFSTSAVYYILSSGLTANTLQVSSTFKGAALSLSGSNAGTIRVSGSVIDYPGLQNGPYSMHGLPAFSRWPSVLTEFASYAGVYIYRGLSMNMDHLFSDSCMHGIVFGCGYNSYSAPTTGYYTDWMNVDRLEIRPTLGGLYYDTLHTNTAAVKFEDLGSGSRFNGLAVSQLSIVGDATTPDYPYAFNLGASDRNARVIISKVVESNGFVSWLAPGSKAPEMDTPFLATAADQYNGWFQLNSTNRGYAVNGTHHATLGQGNLKLEKADGTHMLSLKNTSTGTEVAATIGTGSIAFDDFTSERRLGAFSGDSTQASLFLGSLSYTTNARASFITGERISGSAGVTNGNAGVLYVFGSAGTGSSATGGDIQFWTFDAGSSGTSAQSSSAKVRIPRVGGIYLPGQASDPSATAAGHFYYSSGARGFRFYDGSYWQPLSVHSDEVTVPSASNVNLGFQSSDKVYITGTNTISSFGAALAGTRRNVRFEGVLTLNQNATSMILPGGVSIITEPNDTGEAVCTATGNWRVIWYQRASGVALVSSGGLTDGDKGDITVSGSGSTLMVDGQSISYSKVQNVSATDKVLGRASAGAGVIEEISLTAAGRALIDDIDASAQRTTLGLGTLATQSGTFSGTSSGTNTGDQSAGNPSASIGLTAVNGSATTFLRSDGAPALDVSISPTWTGAHAFTKNGALSLPTVSITGTPITGGTATTTKPLVLIETSGATSAAWSTGGALFGLNSASGFAGRTFDFQANGVSTLNLSAAGTLSGVGNWNTAGNIIAGGTLNLSWFGRSEMLSPSDGVILLQNAANTDFTRLQLGGTTTSFPAFGRNGTTIAVQLADGTTGGKLSVGATQAKVGGTIDQKFTSTGTPASAVETDLHSFTTVASSLGTDGDGFTLTSGGTFAGNASATSQLRVYFGGTQIFATGALTAAAAGSWAIECEVIRSSATTARCITQFTAPNAVTTPLVTQTDLTGLTLSNSNILKVTGQGGGASPAVNDIVYKLGRIRFEPVY